MILGEWQFDQGRDCLVFILLRQEVAAVAYFTEAQSNCADDNYGSGWYARSIFRDTPGSASLGPFNNQYNAQRAVLLEVETIALVTANTVARQVVDGVKEELHRYTPATLESLKDSV